MSSRMQYITLSGQNRAAAFSACLLSAILIVACDSGTTPAEVTQSRTLQLASQKIRYYESDGTGNPIAAVAPRE